MWMRIILDKHDAHKVKQEFYINTDTKSRVVLIERTPMSDVMVLTDVGKVEFPAGTLKIGTICDLPADVGYAGAKEYAAVLEAQEQLKKEVQATGPRIESPHGNPIIPGSLS